jgi:hypothetical protein
MSCNIFLFLKITVYIEGSMSIFIIYIGIIGPQSHFDNTNFRTSLVIKIIVVIFKTLFFFFVVG